MAAALHTSLSDGLDPAAADGTDLDARRCVEEAIPWPSKLLCALPAVAMIDRMPWWRGCAVFCYLQTEPQCTGPPPALLLTILPLTILTILPLGRASFGANKFKAIPPKNFFKLWFGNLKDPTLIMLMVAALVGPAVWQLPAVAELPVWAELRGSD